MNLNELFSKSLPEVKVLVTFYMPNSKEVNNIADMYGYAYKGMRVPAWVNASNKIAKWDCVEAYFIKK